MAIYHFSTKSFSRSKGSSAVAAAAYRAGEDIINQKDGVRHNYTNKGGVIHTEIILPEGEKSISRNELWNMAEAKESRKDARVARELLLALPHELTVEDMVRLTREFAKGVVKDYGVAVDFAIHEPDKGGDDRNFHAHLLLTTRKLEKGVLTDKSTFELSTSDLKKHGLPTIKPQLRDIRLEWANACNLALSRSGAETRIDSRSYLARGIDLIPGIKLGQKVVGMLRRGEATDRGAALSAIKRANLKDIKLKSASVLTLLSDEKSVFSRGDINRCIHRLTGVEGVKQEEIATGILANVDVLEIGQRRGSPVYTTRQTLELEAKVFSDATWLKENVTAKISEKRIERVLTKSILNEEQKQAVRGVVASDGLSLVEGAAGTGKSTMLGQARKIFESSGYRVVGGALAGKAAEGLEKSSGIKSNTLFSWIRGWERGDDRFTLKKGSVFVLDEAGMVGSRQMSDLLAYARERKVKVVMVGDSKQLQPIAGGGIFHSLANNFDKTTLSNIIRQGHAWQREATAKFAQGDAVAAFRMYSEKGRVNAVSSATEGRKVLVSDYMDSRQNSPEKSHIMLAHMRVDVAALNEAVREKLKAIKSLGRSRSFQTIDGRKEFAAGDQVVFLEGNWQLGVKNGTLGTVEKVTLFGALKIRTDKGKEIKIDAQTYNHIDHGYAVTIHKDQGATADKSFVLASDYMDSHLTYVAMSRHKEDVKLYTPSHSRIMRNLARDNTKKTTLDYTAQPAQDAPQSEIKNLRADRQGFNLKEVNMPDQPAQGFKPIKGKVLLLDDTINGLQKLELLTDLGEVVITDKKIKDILQKQVNVGDCIKLSVNGNNWQVEQIEQLPNLEKKQTYEGKVIKIGVAKPNQNGKAIPFVGVQRKNGDFVRFWSEGLNKAAKAQSIKIGDSLMVTVKKEAVLMNAKKEIAKTWQEFSVNFKTRSIKTTLDYTAQPAQDAPQSEIKNLRADRQDFNLKEVNMPNQQVQSFKPIKGKVLLLDDTIEGRQKLELLTDLGEVVITDKKIKDILQKQVNVGDCIKLSVNGNNWQVEQIEQLPNLEKKQTYEGKVIKIGVAKPNKNARAIPFVGIQRKNGDFVRFWSEGLSKAAKAQSIKIGDSLTVTVKREAVLMNAKKEIAKTWQEFSVNFKTRSIEREHIAEHHLPIAP